MKPIETLDQAMALFDETLAHAPERDAFAAQGAAAEGHRRRYPVLCINHLGDPSDMDQPQDDFELPEVRVSDAPEGKLAAQIVNMLTPLKMLNPISPCFSVSHGPGTLVPSFGIPLNPELQNGPAFLKPIRQVLAEPVPDPAHSGLMPEMRRDIETIRTLTPPRFKIGFPDLQGPFNLAHAIVGEEIMTAPYEDLEAFHALMERVTTFWIEAQRLLSAWIGDDRRPPFELRTARIAECSVNLVSPDFYRRHIAPHDLRISQAFENLSIHPCSGPHVFRVTLECLPNVTSTEAGHIAKTAAGAISVEEALEVLGDRPIGLGIGQELPEGQEYEFICRDLDRYRKHPRLTFGYTGMHWRKKHRPLIRDMHRRVDAYWEQHVAADRP